MMGEAKKTLPCNAARGEVLVVVDGVPIVLAAETQKLAFLSSELGCTSWKNLIERVSGAELSAMYMVLNLCVVRGDIEAATRAMSLRGAFAVAGAMTKAMVFHLPPPDEDDGGNAQTAKESE